MKSRNRNNSRLYSHPIRNWLIPVPKGFHHGRMHFIPKLIEGEFHISSLKNTINPITKKQKKTTFFMVTSSNFSTNYNSTVWDLQPNPPSGRCSLSIQPSQKPTCVIKPPVPLDKPPSFEAKRAESIAWNEKTEPVAVGWLARERTGSAFPNNSFGVFRHRPKVCWGILLGFFSRKAKKNQRNWFFKITVDQNTIQQKLTWFTPEPRTRQKEEKIPILGS